MIRPLDISHLARIEYDKATNWYEDEEKGLGKVFVTSVRATLNQIARHPERYAVAYGDDIREALVKRFPYVIYFRVITNRIAILAIIHTSRDPHEWQRRV